MASRGFVGSEAYMRRRPENRLRDLLPSGMANIKVPGTALQTYYINGQPMDPGEPGFRLRLWLRRDELPAAFRFAPRLAPSHDAVVWLAKA